LRFLAGCAVVVAIVAAIVLSVALLIGWRLTRDEAPGRAPETFLVGDESRYWCLDLKPSDAGLAALFARSDEINDATRRDLFRGTFLDAIPFPHRRARLDELAPFTLELSLFLSSPEKELPVPTGWAARGTFSHGVFGMRTALKLMRFVASRNPTEASVIDVGGVAVTELHDENTAVAVATVGNRVLVANDAARMRAILRPEAESPNRRLPELLTLHKEVALEGEDAWAFISVMPVGGLSKALSVGSAAASFDVNDRDELFFRMIVMDAGLAEEGKAFRGNREDCSLVASTFLPVVPASAIEINGDGASPGDHGGKVFSGRVAGLSKRLAELLGRARELRLRGRVRERSAPETPSASPTPPTRPPPSGPRSGTPGGPTSEETPKPPR
jgi:hypothetical protein